MYLTRPKNRAKYTALQTLWQTNIVQLVQKILNSHFVRKVGRHGIQPVFKIHTVLFCINLSKCTGPLQEVRLTVMTLVSPQWCDPHFGNFACQTCTVGALYMFTLKLKDIDYFLFGRQRKKDQLKNSSDTSERTWPFCVVRTHKRKSYWVINSNWQLALASS